MKTIILSTAFAFVAGAAMAADTDWNATQFATTFQSGQFELSLGTVDGELNTVSTTATDLVAYNLGIFDTSLNVGLTYGRLDETLAVSAKYGLSVALNPVANVYGSSKLAYVTPTADLGEGKVYTTPTIGASYTVIDGVTTFAEVSYDWNVSDDWERLGGALQVGADFFVAESVTLTPSVVRTFDTGADATNLKVEAALRF